MIECERKSKSHREKEKPAARMKTGGVKSSLAQKRALINLLTREALLKCDFSGDVLDGVEKSEDYIRDAKILREMRRDYNVFRSQLGSLEMD